MQVAVLQIESLEVGEVSERGGEGLRVGEDEVGEIEIEEVCEISECRGNASLQRIRIALFNVAAQQV